MPTSSNLPLTINIKAIRKRHTGSSTKRLPGPPWPSKATAKIAKGKCSPLFKTAGRLPVAKQGFAPLKFQPGQDGLTFKVEGGFLSEIPPELIGAGTKLGHAPGPIKFRIITGPAIQTGPETFRIQFDRGGMGGPIWIQEEHPGDDQYRHAVQPGQMVIPPKLDKGKPQTITFPKIENQKAGVKSIKLEAVSDSGLPVDYYVLAGPAEVEGDTLKLTPIPVRSEYPVKVTIVAYQWGRTIEPLYQSAQPVEQTFTIEK